MIKVYNTLTKKLEVFKPLRKKEVRMYTCGPTVYMSAHIGNFRAYLFADVLRRYFEYKGYKVKQVSNITDVGHLTQDDIEAGKDKIQEAAKKKNISPYDLAHFYEDAYVADRKRLNLRPLYKMPRATDHIKEMQEMIKVLIKKGHAYEVNGSVYYDITTFKNYGKLSGNTIEQLEEGASGRDLEMNKEKKHFYDFALWVNDPEHMMNWPSPWCKFGYPGWHIECSAMSLKYLGKQFDIHTGGEDNIFPHHESEIAQSEGYTGKKWVSYWMHNRHLLVDGQKMSKSIGNFYTQQDIYDRGFTPQQLRFFLIGTHYRKKFNFTLDAFEASNKALSKLLLFAENLKKVESNSTKNISKIISVAKSGFEEAMDTDLNTSGAYAAIFELIRAGNKLLEKTELGKTNAKKILDLLNKFNIVLGVFEMKSEKKAQKELSTEIKKLIEKREELRKEKKWVESDKIRQELTEKGILLDDTPEGTRWKLV